MLVGWDLDREGRAVSRLFLGRHSMPLAFFIHCREGADDLERDLCALWFCALDSVGFDLCSYGRRGFVWACAYAEREDGTPSTAWEELEPLGIEGGVDSMLEAYWKGVPLEDLLA